MEWLEQILCLGFLVLFYANCKNVELLLLLSWKNIWHRNENIWRFQNVFHNRLWSALSVSVSLFLSLSFSLSVSVSLSLSLSVSPSLSFFLSLSLIQLCEIEFPTENWIRNCQWCLAKKWHYVQIMILPSVYKHHI